MHTQNRYRPCYRRWNAVAVLCTSYFKFGSRHLGFSTCSLVVQYCYKPHRLARRWHRLCAPVAISLTSWSSYEYFKFLGRHLELFTAGLVVRLILQLSLILNSRTQQTYRWSGYDSVAIRLKADVNVMLSNRVWPQWHFLLVLLSALHVGSILSRIETSSGVISCFVDNATWLRKLKLNDSTIDWGKLFADKQGQTVLVYTVHSHV